MRLATNRTLSDCGPVAIFNALEMLGHRQGVYTGARGRELRRRCMPARGDGTARATLLRVLRQELRGTPWTAHLLDPVPAGDPSVTSEPWQYVIDQVKDCASGIGILEAWVCPEGAQAHERMRHVGAVWTGSLKDGPALWGANWAGAAEPRPLFLSAKGSLWATIDRPDSPEVLWVITRRR